MKDHLVVGLLSPLRLMGTDDGVMCFALIDKFAPALSPELYGNAEPLTLPYSSPQQIAASWRPPLLWKRKGNSVVEGAAWFDNPGAHSAFYISVQGRDLAAGQAVALLEGAADRLSVDFGYVHLLTERETASPTIHYDKWYPFDIGVTSYDLRKGLPNLPWALVLGPPYVKLLGMEQLLATSCFAAKALSHDRVYLQATAAIDDVRRDFPAFEAFRQRLRSELGDGIFAPSAQGTARVPLFTLPTG